MADDKVTRISLYTDFRMIFWIMKKIESFQQQKKEKTKIWCNQS